MAFQQANQAYIYAETRYSKHKSTIVLFDTHGRWGEYSWVISRSSVTVESISPFLVDLPSLRVKYKI